MALTNRQWVLRQRPQGLVQDSDLELISTPVPDLADGQVLVRTIYLSLDPTNRTWMNDAVGYLPPVGLGDVMRGLTLGVVEQSKSERFAVGDIVTTAMGGWADYGVVPDSGVSRAHRFPGLPLTANMSVLGMTGLTAWAGVTDVLRPQPGQTMVVSAAAGAVGSIAGQIAKQKGARVIGIAGGPQKCAWLTGELGFDGAIDYKNEDVGAALDRLCPNGIDVNFENVGGEIMDAVISRMNNFGRVPLCGMISGYNSEGVAAGPTDFARILMHRLTIRGFIVIDFIPRAMEAIAELAPAVMSGQLKWKAHVVDGLENAAEAVKLLFTGAHDGKLLVRISPEP
ncbi:MAG: NADP-dependent oxidoreductase [Brevundimonas sp.]